MQLYTKISLLTIALAFGFTSSSAQETEGFYIDSSGKLFVNPNTPVFLYMSLSPDGKEAIRLKSIQPEGNPLQWNGHGPKYLSHLDLYLGKRINFELFADGKPPTTSPNFDTKKGIQEGAIIYLSGTSVLEIKSIDEDSGVSKSFYSINGANFLKYEKPIILEKEGKYSIQFYSIDNVGNKEDIGERTLYIDTSPPETTMEIEGPQHNDVVSTMSKFILSANDIVGVSKTYYSINDGTETLYTIPISISQLPQGDYTIKWYSIDMVGNTENQKSYSFFVDRTPPMVFEEISGNTYMIAGKEFSSGRSQLRIVAVDNKAGVKEIHYSINNEPFKIYEKPIYLSDITGAVTIRSYAIDNVGNKGVSNVEGQHFSMPQVDITGPSISHSFIGNKISLRDTVWINPQTKVSIAAIDKGSGLHRVDYKLNDNPNLPYSEPFSVDQNGYHRVSCTAWDNVENLNILNFGFGVDGKAPELFHHFSVQPHQYKVINSEKIPVFSPDLQLYIAATDDKAGVDKILVAIDEAKERIYAQPLSGFKVGQITTIILKAIDKLGNESEKSISFWVE
jgi:hypothetical protein